VNVFGLWNLLNACNSVGYELFVNTGSSSEYGAKQYAMRENDILEPNSFYAVAKSAQSLLCQHCARTASLPLVTLRLFSVYRPYEEPGRLIPNMIMGAINSRRLEMASPKTARDFVYVDDVVRLYLMVDELKQLHGEILNVGTGIQQTLSEVTQALASVCGRDLDIQWEAMEPRIWDSDTWVADCSKLHRKTGFVPRTTIREGLLKCVPWFEAHQDFYR
jgi:nucleoside-diphosphate-sugar epimerase